MTHRRLVVLRLLHAVRLRRNRQTTRNMTLILTAVTSHRMKLRRLSLPLVAPWSQRLVERQAGRNPQARRKVMLKKMTRCRKMTRIRFHLRLKPMLRMLRRRLPVAVAKVRASRSASLDYRKGLETYGQEKTSGRGR